MREFCCLLCIFLYGVYIKFFSPSEESLKYIRMEPDFNLKKKKLCNTQENMHFVPIYIGSFTECHHVRRNTMHYEMTHILHK